jgi:hypothetical protein
LGEVGRTVGVTKLRGAVESGSVETKHEPTDTENGNFVVVEDEFYISSLFKGLFSCE